MTNKSKIALIFALVMLGLLVVSFIVGYHVRDGQIQPPVADTVRIDHWDTTYIPSPPDTIKSVEEKPVPVPYYIKDTDTVHDSVLVVLPFEHHFAQLDSVADIWFSGYQTKIDSAIVYKHYLTQIIKQPYEVTKPPRLTLDLGAGAMWHDNAVKPYAIGKLSFNQPHTTFTAFGAINHEGDWAAGLTVTYRLNIIK